MHPLMEDLVLLAAVDAELGRHRQTLAELPKKLAAAQTRATQAQAAVADASSKLSAEDKLRRRQESDAADLRTKIVRLRKNLDSATSAAQVTAFEREISFAEKAVATLEDEELASMERAEALESTLKRLQEAAQKAAEAHQQEQQRAGHITSELNAALRALDQERQATRDSVARAPEDGETRLRQYDSLVRTRGSAIAEAVGNALSGQCNACQMAVRTQRWQNLIGRDHRDEIFTCESCGRMLFWDPRRDSPQAWPSGDRWRTASQPATGASKR